MPLAFTRTGSRAARVGAFALEVWSRLLLDGPALDADARARQLTWIAENLCALHGVRLSVRGTPPKEPCLLVANHMSYFDPLIVASHVPCTVVAKSEIGSWPCVGDVARRLGILMLQRGCGMSGARVLREAMRALERGVSVLVFPEGTTTTGDRVLPFRRGAFGAAALAGVPIVPVALKYACASTAWVGDDMFLPHYMRTIAKPYTRVSVDFLEPLAYARARTVSDLAEHARAAIEEALAPSLPELAVPRFADAWSHVSA